MRGRLIGAIATGAALVATTVFAGTASALPLVWDVSRDDGGTSGGFTGAAGVTVLTTESGIELTCDSASAAGTANLGTGVANPIATLPAGSTQFNNCSGPFGLTFEVAHQGTWELHGDSYASGVTTGRITNIVADISGPFCEATVTGSVNGTFTNSSDELEVLPDQTLTVSTVDPNNDCLGLITQGEAAGFSGVFAITPGLTVVGR
ncbi:hypothetical protein [Actinophytocola algeriensis]|uniref:Secreted protein n=1 Tax=Actinophytocola algeriensis TaxID=1768010 RepID=A0A7W7QEG8_9PSEU|nr:hypothetical protein [Actinophytocola algeriensis]MBB4912122.1 hypothetical protein [Actinophytocola algeriensis]MBE1477386.1 hypothetical protein [Actinophytocola algeriensis]